jgi:8-amino-7-oxononanoate synthase
VTVATRRGNSGANPVRLLSCAAVSLDDEAKAELARLEAAHLLRVPRVLDGPQGPHVTVDGAVVTSFASNDYLGLADDPRLSSAAALSLQCDGAGAGASRLIIGNHRRHVELEAAVADWLRCDGVRLFNTGYAANVGVIATLARAGDVVFSDELNHASIIDGCRLSRAEVVVYPHGDLAALEQGLKAARGARRLVVSESLFSMDGDLADVAALGAVCRRHDAALILDEAHAMGTFGPEGRGVAALAGVVPDVVIGTFGKALGTFGAFAATTRAVADLLWNRARTLVFSTGLPPSVAASTIAAIGIVRGSEGDDRRRTLAAHARRFRTLVPHAGGAAESAIAPIRVDDDQRVMLLTARLLEERIFVQGIRPPTVPVGTARLRVSLSSRHAADDVEKAARAIAAATAR